MTDAYGTVDTELLHDQIVRTEVVVDPIDADLGLSVGNLLSYIRESIDNNGFVVLFAERSDLPYQLKVKYDHQQAQKEMRNG